MSNSPLLKVFTGNANPDLAKEICQCLGVPLGKAEVGHFSDGEIQLKIMENVRGADTYVVQPTSPPVNDNLMELLIMVDALARASARRITVVTPYYGYGRQDRKAEPRVPITAKLVANLIVAAGASRVLSMDLHAGQIQGFFDIPVDHLYAMPVFLEYIRAKNLTDIVIVSPDAGGVERARAFAKRLDADLAIVDKRRPRANVADVMNVIGDVKGRTAILLDDIVDTAGTLSKDAEALKTFGAKRVFAACSHGVLSGPAIDRINKSPIEELMISNSIPLNGKPAAKVKVLSVAPLLAEAIKRIHDDESVSQLFV
ncbi:MAG TPA: ribose-phosphate pyrophosphokinase [Elusimicrobiota bacterium]|nr:ribose-phosphate pyrophosphokinase [Elusimicrobiota bacterium]